MKLSGACGTHGVRPRFRMIIPAYPAFNIYSEFARRTTALGPVFIATAVADLGGWDVEVIDENNYRAPGPTGDNGLPDHRRLQELRPADVVGFYGGLTCTVPRLYELSSLYRTLQVPTVAGGQHFTEATVDEAFDHGIDVIVNGEGEQTIKDLLVAHLHGDPVDTVTGITYRDGAGVIRTPDRALLTNFDFLPLPDFSLVAYAKIRVYPVNWVRGCGMHCEFCTVKGTVRCPPPEHVYRQIMHLVERNNARSFFIVDDLFGQNRKQTLELCEMLAEFRNRTGVKLDFTVQIRLDKSKDTELLQAMRDAGVTMVAIGFESPIREELQAMNKKLDPEDMVRMAAVYRKHGFLVHGMFIFGYPMMSGSSFSMSAAQRSRRFRQFIRKARIDTVQVLHPVPLPGTEMTARLDAQHRIYSHSSVGWEYYDGNFPLFEPDAPLTAEEMQCAINGIMGRFYRFNHMFMIGWSIIAFPVLILFLHNLRAGWRRWYRSWRNHLLRFTGWIIIRRWTVEFKKGNFRRQLAEARIATLSQMRSSAELMLPQRRPSH